MKKKGHRPEHYLNAIKAFHAYAGMTLFAFARQEYSLRRSVRSALPPTLTTAKPLESNPGTSPANMAWFRSSIPTSTMIRAGLLQIDHA